MKNCISVQEQQDNNTMQNIMQNFVHFNFSNKEKKKRFLNLISLFDSFHVARDVDVEKFRINRRSRRTGFLLTFNYNKFNCNFDYNLRFKYIQNKCTLNLSLTLVFSSFWISRTLKSRNTHHKYIHQTANNREREKYLHVAFGLMCLFLVDYSTHTRIHLHNNIVLFCVLLYLALFAMGNGIEMNGMVCRRRGSEI